MCYKLPRVMAMTRFNPLAGPVVVKLRREGSGEMEARSRAYPNRAKLIPDTMPTSFGLFQANEAARRLQKGTDLSTGVDIC